MWGDAMFRQGRVIRRRLALGSAMVVVATAVLTVAIPAEAEPNAISCAGNAATTIVPPVSSPSYSTTPARYRFTIIFNLPTGCVDEWNDGPILNDTYDHSAVSGAKITLRLYTDDPCDAPRVTVGGQAQIRLLNSAGAVVATPQAAFVAGVLEPQSGSLQTFTLVGATKKTSSFGFPGRFDSSMLVELAPGGLCAGAGTKYLVFQSVHSPVFRISQM
jgi:hypothetical protein